MKRLLFIEIIAIVVGLLLIPVVIHAQAEQATTKIPPIGQQWFVKVTSQSSLLSHSHWLWEYRTRG